MKIAIVHDYIKEYGGAERVLEVFHEIWPEAPIFTSVFLPDFLGPHKDRFLDWDIRASILQGIPRVEKLISPLRVVTPWIFENINFLDYDLVIVSDYGHGFLTKKIRDLICAKAKYLALNVQTNSANIGFNLVTKYRRANCVCIDELELRYATHERFSDLRAHTKKI